MNFPWDKLPSISDVRLEREREASAAFDDRTREAPDIEMRDGVYLARRSGLIGVGKTSEEARGDLYGKELLDHSIKMVEERKADRQRDETLNG